MQEIPRKGGSSLHWITLTGVIITYYTLSKQKPPVSFFHSGSFDFELIGSMTSMPKVVPEELMNLSVAIASAVPPQ